jgi:OOP family OmpA-OmpF porin
MKIASLGALSLLALAGPLMAETAEPSTLPSFDTRWYIAPFATYTWADENRGTDDGAGFGLAVGKPINRWLNLELRATYTDLVSQTSTVPPVPVGYVPEGDFDVGDVALDALFVFGRGVAQPFLLAGLGAISDDFSCDRTAANNLVGCRGGSSKWSFMAEAGAGVMFAVSEYVSLRIDGRYRYDDNSSDLRNSSDFGDWIVTAGVVIPIGARSKPAVSRKYELAADALFAFNKDRLSPVGVSTIDNFARDLDKFDYTGVQVDGHTDPLGSDAYNQDLSDRRANTVRTQLISEGVPADRLRAQGFGETQLKIIEAECRAQGAKTKEALIACLQPNRRVEVTVDGMTDK